MFDWIPISSYTAVYFNVLMVIMLIILLHAYRFGEFGENAEKLSRILGYVTLCFVLAYMGTRPISNIFGDMGTYAGFYRKIQAGETVSVRSDFLFNYFMKYCAKVMSVHSFFFVCSLLYTLPCYLFAKKYGGAYWFFVFFIFVGSMMFWPFGTNGIRNGLGTAIFLLALYFYDKKVISYALVVLSYGMHSSLIIAIAAFIISGLYKNPKVYLFVWLASIPLSLIGGSVWETFFGSLGFTEDSRAEDYLNSKNIAKDAFAYTGFRWDFLFYSCFAAFAGWYYIFRKGITDKFYIHLWGIYMLGNAFWILVIRANYSNRFAYLSWFLMAPIIAYPLLKYKMVPNQYRVMGIVAALYFLFTYVMYLRS